MNLESIAEILNEAWIADPVAIRSLLCYQTPVNEELANHPTIQCSEFAGGYAMTFLGLLNGLVGSPDLMISTQWSEEKDEEGAHEFLGFGVVKPVFLDEE
jgi:hypothetical protein